MRDYDKKTENDLNRIFSEHLEGKFVQPITANYPKPCKALETMLYGFLNHFGKDNLKKLADRKLIRILNEEYWNSCTDAETKEKCPCGITNEPFIFTLNDVQFLIIWDHGYIAESWWKWMRGKWRCFSRYRLGLFHSDDTPIDMDQFTDEQFSHMITKLTAKLDGELKAIEDKRKQEIEFLLGKEEG